MKTKLVVFLLAGSLLAVNPLAAQGLKAKLAAKMSGKGGGGKSKGKTYDFEDPTGISGTYYTSEQIIDRQNTIGFKFTKEENGEIINKLYVVLGGKGYSNRPNNMTFALKEKYQKKYGINYFYMTEKEVPKLANNRDKWRFVSIADNIYAFAQNDQVLCVAAKDNAVLADYDVETAQVLFDQQMAKINTEAMEKETAKWMENPVYKKYVGKIVFSDADWKLMKRGYINRPPMVKEDGIMPVLDMGGNMLYMAYFKFPPAKQYPGKEINVVYELNGKTTSRTTLKGESAAWSNMIKRLETKDYAHRQHGPRPLREYNTYKGQYVQDYAFIKLLYDQKDKFTVGSQHTVTVKMYASSDGEDQDLLAEGTVKLTYSKAAKKAYEGDPEKPEIKGVWEHFEAFLDE